MIDTSDTFDHMVDAFNFAMQRQADDIKQAVARQLGKHATLAAKYGAPLQWREPAPVTRVEIFGGWTHQAVTSDKMYRLRTTTKPAVIRTRLIFVGERVGGITPSSISREHAITVHRDTDLHQMVEEVRALAWRWAAGASCEVDEQPELVECLKHFERN